MKGTSRFAVAGLVALALNVGPTLLAVQADEKVLRVAVAGGTFQRALNAAYFAPFANETGTTIEFVGGGEDPIATLRAQVMAGRVEFDISVGDYAVVGPMADLVADHGITLPSDLLFTQPFQEKLVPILVGSAWIVACNKDRVAKCPTTYAEYFDDEAFPGDRSMPNVGSDGVPGILEAALLADGVGADELYPLDMDRAFAKLATIRDSIRTFWTSSPGSQDVMRSGEVTINLMRDARANQLVFNDGMNLNVSLSESLGYMDCFFMPNKAPNEQSARDFLAWVVDRPVQQAVFTSLTFFGPPTERGIEAARKLGILDHTSLHIGALRIRTAAQAQVALDWYNQNVDTMMERWNAFVGG